MDGDGALIHSSASLPFKPLLTLNVGKADVVPSLAANRAGCDRERLFHFKTILISGCCRIPLLPDATRRCRIRYESYPSMKAEAGEGDQRDAALQ